MSSANSSSARIRFGCCGSMISAADPLSAHLAGPLAALGFDYIELSLRDVAALSEPAFRELAATLHRSGLACEACNNFFPAAIRLTGPDADLPAALRYADAALARAATLGAAVVVFGSAVARNVPAGFPLPAACAQLRALLTGLGPLAAAHGLVIVIEPLHRGEANIINSIAEAGQLAREVNHPQVRVLADSFHLLLEDESTAILAATGPALTHVHVASGRDRLFPLAGDIALRNFMTALRDSGYTGRCSIEGFTQDFAADAARALPLLREWSAPAR